MKYVVIVNGKPQSGKTTFQEMCSDMIDKAEIAYPHIVSTIDPIKNLYRQLGWNGEKTDKARKDLSVLKQMWIDNCDGPTKFIVKFLIELDNESDHVVFVDVREENEIDKLTDVLGALKPLDIDWYTILIERPDMDGMEYGNKSDDNVSMDESLYTHHIINGSDLQTLRSIAVSVMCDIMDTNIIRDILEEEIEND